MLGLTQFDFRMMLRFTVVDFGWRERNLAGRQRAGSENFMDPFCLRFSGNLATTFCTLVAKKV